MVDLALSNFFVLDASRSCNVQGPKSLERILIALCEGRILIVRHTVACAACQSRTRTGIVHSVEHENCVTSISICCVHIAVRPPDWTFETQPPVDAQLHCLVR